MTCKCNLIIDSCCDLPFDVVNREGVYLLNFPYIDSQGEHYDDLYQTISPKEFFDTMRNGESPSTAQIPMPAIQKAYDWAYEQGKPTVFICFSSGLSGTYGTVEMLADQARADHPDFELYTVDSKLASVAEALLVYEAINQREKGLTASELAKWAQEALYYVNAQFMLENFDALARGGRIPSSVAFAGSKLDLKPLLSFDLEGHLSLVGMARGRKKGMKQMVEFYQQNTQPSYGIPKVIIGNADVQKDAEKLMDMVSKGDSTVLFLESSIGPVIGSHVGPGMIAIVFWGIDRRDEVSIADRIAKKVKGK